MSATTPDALRDFTGQLIHLARVYRRAVDRRFREHGLSDARAMPVLHIARAGGGMRQGVLAEALGIEGPSLVRLLDQICAAGLVERRDDPSDRRAKTLHVTAAGRDMATLLEGLLVDLRADLLDRVTGEDLTAVLRVFSVLSASLDEAEARERGA